MGCCVSGFRLVDRDYLILREIDRWRVITGKHICGMTGFTGLRACDRRLHKLYVAGFIERKKVIYGLPAIYKLTPQAKKLLVGTNKKECVRIEQIAHDMAVADTAIYFNRKYNIAFSDMVTEKQLHKKDGFGVRKHRPDFIFDYKDKCYCVEIELSMKSKDRFSKNIIANFTDYHKQFWIVPDINSSIAVFLSNMNESYPNIKIIELAEVKSIEYF